MAGTVEGTGGSRFPDGLRASVVLREPDRGAAAKIDAHSSARAVGQSLTALEFISVGAHIWATDGGVPSTRANS